MGMATVMDGYAMDSLAMDGARAWLWTARRQCDGDGWLVSNAMATGQRDGDGRLDGDGNKRLSYGWLGNHGRCNGLAMDSLMAT